MGCPAHLREFDSDVPGPSERVPDPDSVNRWLLDRLLKHRHFLLMAENGLVRDVVGPLREAREDISEQLALLAGRQGASEVNELLQESLNELRRTIDEVIRAAEQDATERMRQGLEDVAERETEIQRNILRQELPASVTGLADFTPATAERVQRMLATPIGGKRWNERMRDNFGRLTVQMKRDLSTSIALGEGMGDAQRRLRKSVDKLGVQRATTIARTEIQRVANEAASDLYKRNRQVIKGVQWIATLDSRTCFICAPLDGNTWELNETRPEPPQHANCRCYMMPITRSFEELGIDAEEFGPGTRASMDGQVPSTMDYGEWFRKQPESFQREWLGPARFERFEAGDLDLDDLSTTQRVLSVDELPEA